MLSRVDYGPRDEAWLRIEACRANGADIKVISKTVISDGKSELIDLLITGFGPAILAMTLLVGALTVSKRKQNGYTE